MLARTLGRTLDELAESMSLSEFLDHWQDFNQDPWGDKRADARTALLCQTVVKWAGKTLKEGVDIPLKHFLLTFEPVEAEEPDPIAYFKQFM